MQLACKGATLTSDQVTRAIVTYKNTSCYMYVVSALLQQLIVCAIYLDCPSKKALTEDLTHFKIVSPKDPAQIKTARGKKTTPYPSPLRPVAIPIVVSGISTWQWLQRCKKKTVTNRMYCKSRTIWWVQISATIFYWPFGAIIIWVGLAGRKALVTSAFI